MFPSVVHDDVRIVDVAMEIDRALLIGIGGGGDVVSTLYIRSFLEKFGVECVCGGVVWERFRRDRKPGPRSIDEIEGAEKISPTLGFVRGGEMVGSVEPIVSQVAGLLGERVLAVSITRGASLLREDIGRFVRENRIDAVFAVDAGGDSLALGHEETLVSPLADSIMLSALKDENSILAVVGFGSDGELDRKTLERYLSELHDSVYGVSIVEVDERFAEFLKSVESEASKIPALARMGYFGNYRLWGELDVNVSLLNSLVFYLDLRSVYLRSRMARALDSTCSVEEASRILNEMGVRTEYDLEVELAKREGLL